MNKCITYMIGLLFAASSWGDTSLSDASQLWAKLQDINSLSAHFTQSVYSADDTLVQESQGQLIVRKPGLMHWQATEPYRETVVIDGSRIWFHDADLEQVTVRDFHEDLRQLPALVFTSDEASLAAAFDVKKTSAQQFELSPFDANHYVRKLTLRWEGDIPIELVIEDNLANRTRLQFSRVTTNTLTDNRAFQFKVPEGADVIDQTGQAGQ